MKIAPLLAQYLYTYKRLDLPGIGTIILDSIVNPETENKKYTPTELEGVVFENNPSIKDSPELVSYISSQTGKIKALAAADLHSLLAEAQQVLNIGKPFPFDGIGSFTKIKAGVLAFTAGYSIPFSDAEYTVQDNVPKTPIELSNSDYKKIFYQRKGKSSWQKPIAAMFLVLGLGLAIWGGYIVYKRTTNQNKKAPAEVKNVTSPVKDTAQEHKDNHIDIQSSTVIPTGNYKFVIEKADRERALIRFARLKSFGLDIQMETSDSVSFKLFFIRPALVADTARMVDSLRRLYTPVGNNAFVDN